MPIPTGSPPTSSQVARLVMTARVISAAFGGQESANPGRPERRLVAGDRGEHGLHVAGRQGRQRDGAEVRDEVTADMRPVAAAGGGAQRHPRGQPPQATPPVVRSGSGATAGDVSASSAATAVSLAGNPPRRTRRRSPGADGRSAPKYPDRPR
jgi:hypothetical protein